MRTAWSLRSRSSLVAAMLFGAFALSASPSAFASESGGFHPPSTPLEPVVDAASLLSSSMVGRLNRGLRALRDSGGPQIVVLSVDSLEGVEIEQASIQTFDAWKLGAKGRDDGVLILVAKTERRARIEVGRGLEGDVPDVIAKRIISDLMTPRFRTGDYDGGVFAGVAKLVQVASPSSDVEALFGARPGRVRSNSRGGMSLGRLIFLVIAVLVMGTFFNGGSGRRMGGGPYLGGWGGGGGFGGGGFGGGGFGGGGGGSSGGGASGSW